MPRGSRIVYSTTDGDLRRPRDPGLRARRADGDRVTVRREVAGRRGKPVTTVAGVPVDAAGRKALARTRKRRGGGGGAGEGGGVAVQGDHRGVVVEVLRAAGYAPVLAGG